LLPVVQCMKSARGGAEVEVDRSVVRTV